MALTQMNIKLRASTRDALMAERRDGETWGAFFDRILDGYHGRTADAAPVDKSQNAIFRALCILQLRLTMVESQLGMPLPSADADDAETGDDGDDGDGVAL